MQNVNYTEIITKANLNLLDIVRKANMDITKTINNTDFHKIRMDIINKMIEESKNKPQIFYPL